MDSDEDFQSIPPQEEASPQIQSRRFKRLKKANPKPPANSSLEPTGDPLLLSSVDFSKLEALEDESGALDSNDSNSADDLLVYQESVSQGNIDENENASKDSLDVRSNAGVKTKTKRALEFDAEHVEDVGERSNDIELEKGQSAEEIFPEKKGSKKKNKSKDSLDVGSNAGVKKKTKRALEFDAEHVEDVGERSNDIELEKGQSAEEIFPEKKGSKKKNKRRKSDDTDEPVNNRRKEKERKAYLKELHAESQRLLRESSGAAFKPTPVTRKPISSILEKIRKRKLELSKKFSIPNDQTRSEDDDSSREKIDFEVPKINEIKTVEKDMVTSGVDVQRSLTPPKLDGCDDGVRPINHEDVNQALNQDPMLPFRAPLQDTEDLFDESQSNDNAVEPDSEKQRGPLDEEFVPSVLDINLKFDSVPTDDSSSDDEDNDKENVDPIHVIPGGSSPIGDYVKNFVDDEAEEEDDSDHDPDHLHENEEGEDVENYEDLEDMIATEYEERPIDKETRNTLHQQWLEQQDATGTDNLLQRLKCGPGIRDTILPDNEPESDEDDEGFDDDEDDELQEQMVPRNSARVTTRKAKQIILQMFSDKEDVYLSDDEDTHWRIAKQRLIKNEEKGTLVSPVDDEDYCEVFGLIKKLDIATGNKKKPKPSSYFDTILKGGNSNSSSKSSFLGRVSNHPIPSSNKQGSGTGRSFIFGRDDSSSKSSITVSEDTSDSVSRDIEPTRSFASKLSSSLTKFSSKNIDAAASTTSLLEILKRPSSRSNICNQDTTVDLSKSIFSSKVPKTTMKIQGRS